MKPWIYVLVAGILLLPTGCGKSPVAKDIQQLRIEGHLDEARELALSNLNSEPARMEIWLEFALTVVEQARVSEREDDAQQLNYLIEATLVCGSYYKFTNRSPSREWRDASRLAAAEATKQANKVLTALNAQCTSVDYLKQLLSTGGGPESEKNYAEMSAQRMVDDYRAHAHTLLFQSTLMQRMLELLPEVSSGSSTLIISQIQDARDRWQQELQLSADLVQTMTNRANRAIDGAVSQVMGDLQSLGYFLPGSILDNGVAE